MFVKKLLTFHFISAVALLATALPLSAQEDVHFGTIFVEDIEYGFY